MEQIDTKNLALYVSTCPKKTQTKAYLSFDGQIAFKNCAVFGNNDLTVVFGDKRDIMNALSKHKKQLKSCYSEYLCANSGVALSDVSEIDARIEPYAVVREKTEIGKNAVIMMGAVINIGAKIGEKTMIDMNAVVGSNAQIGKNCHVGAGAVVAGVLEPVGATPVVIEDFVTLGANSVVLEGVRVAHHAVIGAGAVVTKDIPPFAVAVGCPAVVKKFCDEKTKDKTKMDDKLR